MRSHNGDDFRERLILGSVPAALFGVCSLLTILFILYYLDWQRQYDFVQVTGRMLEPAGLLKEVRFSKSRRYYVYSPKVRYSYPVDGRDYSGSGVYYKDDPSETDEACAEKAIDNLPGGDEPLTVWYDPGDPTHSFIKLLDKSWVPYAIVICATLAGLGLFGLVHVVKTPSHKLFRGFFAQFAPPRRGLPGRRDNERQQFQHGRCHMRFHLAAPGEGRAESFAEARAYTAPYNPRGLRFEIHPRTPRFHTSKTRGLGDIRTGDPDFDCLFFLRTNDSGTMADYLDGNVKRRITALYRWGATEDLQIILDKYYLTIRKPIRIYTDEERHEFSEMADAVTASLHEFLGARNRRELEDETPGTEITIISSHDAEPSDPVCQICGELVTSKAVFCSLCSTPHHRDCWEYNGRCSVYGCSCTTYDLSPH